MASTDSLPQAPALSSPIDAGSISARLDRLPPTRSVWKLVVLLSLGFFFELYDLLYSGYVAPGLVKSGILSATTHGLFGTTGVASFIAALFSGLFIGTIACGFLADRFGRRAIFTWSLLWYTAANVVMAFQDTAAGLNFWRFVVGLGLGVEMVTIGTYISELVPKQIRGRAFACEQAVGFVAVPVVAFLAYLLVPRAPFGLDGWRWVVLIGAHGAIFVWWIRRGLPESPRWLAQQGRLDEADRVMRALEAKVEAEYGRPLPAPAPAQPVAERGRFRDMWVSPYRSRTIMMTIFNVFQTVGFYGFANWVPTLLIKQGITITSSLMYSSVIALAAPIGPLIGLVIADRFERKSVIVAMAAAIIVCGLMFSQTTVGAFLIVLGIGLTLANNIMSYSFHAYQAELFPTSIRARAVGFVYSWSRFSAIFSSFVIAAVLKGFGTVGVFAFIAGAMVIVMAAIGLMGPRTKGIALETISR
ncbi:MFS transporter [Burkholderia pseudomultivorans]|uniref:Inner membrane metabolite transport protein YdjE n=1 Tax=Burkholderia pseudomultivorans TaxID=1207504 RepID=A0A132EFJ9_9BURK|nr:MFS transporter [Burkholderia pseudomultivorans]KWF28869.1 MFS transporter [Burkholderia pseudomultivorans]MDR8731649.1 Inner membrane metabolite transport protein YdjE [Burkholderia pseudomultivorans]MDR8738167.1 Inner membrane metabolite transport protein YdjE [Burkholderia pseudomultivorans]MDR8744534.1 Inner membrane metabolite transport protein YdjE [Burkholderia pseudomultivorans]MDR8756344.1 Inner membrane metabolite transport protein YdjE [Burkholderia pseudomultivorans]